MTAAEHAAEHAAEAERLLDSSSSRKLSKEVGNQEARRAQVHATLAVYYRLEEAKQ
jgi:hypothetical protein